MIFSNNRVKQIFSLIQEDKKKITLITFLVFFVSFLDILGIGLIGQFIGLILNLQKLEGINVGKNFYDYLNTFDREKVIIFSSLSLLFIFLIKNIISVFIRWYITDFTFKKKIYIQKNLLDFYLSLKLVDFTNKNTAELTETVSELSHTFLTALDSFLRIISEIAMLLIIIIFLSFISFKIVFGSILIFSLSFIIVDFLFKSKLKAYGKNLSISSKKIFAYVSELFRGYKEIKILDKHNLFKQRIIESSKDHAKNNIMMVVIKSLPRYVFEVLIIVILVLFLVLSFLQSGNIITSLPVLAIFAAATLRMVPSLATITSSITIFRFCEYAIEKIFNELKNKENLETEKIKKNVSKVSFNKFEIKDLTFKYPKTDKNLFEKLNFEFNKGETIGIIGESGSGKTTLINIILGLISIDKKYVKLNGSKLNGEPGSWQSIASYIPQDTFIIDDTVKENIILNDDKSQIDNKHLNEILKISDLDHLIQDKQLNLNTNVGENGVKISGGQRQRIAIARALYKKKQVIILDEPTSALDKATENQIIQTILNLKKKHTLIISSHKPSIIDICDKVYEIKNKELKEKI